MYTCTRTEYMYVSPTTQYVTCSFATARRQRTAAWLCQQTASCRAKQARATQSATRASRLQKGQQISKSPPQPQQTALMQVRDSASQRTAGATSPRRGCVTGRRDGRRGQDTRTRACPVCEGRETRPRVLLARLLARCFGPAASTSVAVGPFSTHHYDDDDDESCGAAVPARLHSAS